MDLVALLNCLADGEYHSGVELGSELGVSRTAVWKALSKLEEYGVFLEVTKGKGYRIPDGLDLLDRENMLTQLGQCSELLHYFHLLQSVESTNSYLMADNSLVDPGHYVVCMAERQTAGRGRRGRVWRSPYAKNIYLSLSFNLQGGVESLDGLSLALGVAVAKCLSSQGVKGVGLKWPNDILVGGKKLAGILVELKGEAEQGWKVVAGLGLNVLMSESEGSEIDQSWVSIASLSNEKLHSRGEWGVLLIESIIATIELYRNIGFIGLMAEWEKFDALSQKPVMVVGSDLRGICEGVDERGRLLMRVSGEIKAINAGEVSIRPDESSN
jgi:BirA family transcriptional regulator, biotin operon repressor / biotin---[acetyl-CoA-carboxylase] ligase